MKRVLIAAALAAAAMVVSVPAAHAAAGDCHVVYAFDDEGNPAPTTTTVCREDDWFHQAGQRLSNAPNAAVPSWNTTKPTAAFQDGGAIYGSLRAIDQFQSSSQVRPTFTGTYTGKLDNLGVTFFASSLYSATGGANSLYVTLDVDGETVADNSGGSADFAVPTTKVDDRTYKQSFAFTGLALALKSLKLANGPTTKHNVTVTFVNQYWGDSNFVTYYDAAEYPAGVVFNLEQDPDTLSLPGYAELPTDE
jgi:hypothetical protein